MSSENDDTTGMVVIGAGPAGLTAAYEATRHGARPVVLEASDKVGGIARTDRYKGFYFDMGGHRFFTKNAEVNALWRQVLGEEFLRRPRLSRIYYQRKFFYYPLKPFNALAGLGFVQAVLILLSYLRWHLFPHKVEETFEQWVTNRFGLRLFRTFFKTYTEKVWGIPCSELKAEWAAQRIKDLSLKTAIVNMLVKPRRTIKTLIEEFDYPRLGPGMMWEAFRDQVQSRGGRVHMNAGVVRIERDGKRVTGVVTRQDGAERRHAVSHLVSSMPVTEFVLSMDPPAPEAVREAARHLHYRDFLTVCIMVNRAELFPDNWIYIHDPSVKVGRIQNFKNWSPAMVPDPSKTSLGFEYFCTEGDELWTMPDADLVALATREIERIGLARSADVYDGCVVRVPKAYPIYDADYRGHLAAVREFVDGLENVKTIGRNGLHRYNNQDHAMVTGLLAVRSLLAGEKHDLWAVNTDQEYHEAVTEETRDAARIDEAMGWAFARVDRGAFGVASGVVAAALLFLATLALVLKGGDVVGPNLQLLAQFLPGYEVTLGGSFIGLAYGLVAGFAGGWLFALLRNAALFLSRALLYKQAERVLVQRMLDYL